MADLDLSDLAMCLLEKQPANRPQSATQVIELLTKPREQWSLTVPTYSDALAHQPEIGRRQTVTKAGNSSGRKWSTWIPAMIGLLMLGILGFAFAPKIIRIATDQGEIVIEATDDNVEVEVWQDGETVRVIDTKTQQSFSLKSGQYSFSAVSKDPENELGNSYTIEPKTLTMKRGATAIVSVTVNPKNNAAPQITSGTKSKLIFQGNTFSQWIRILQSNRDHKAQASAIEACLAIMETKQEQQQLLEGTRMFLKTLNRKFVSRSFSNINLSRYRRSSSAKEYKNEVVQFNDLILRVLDSCDRTLVFDFFKAEVEAGTLLSQQVCSNWLATRAGKAVIFDRYMELEETFAEKFDKPVVREMVTSLVRDASLQGESLTQFQESALGRKLKEFVLTAPPHLRVDVSRLAFQIFPDDQQVLRAYQQDLLNPKFNNPSVRYELFEFMYYFVSNADYYDSLNVDATIRQQRLATATDWLGKAMDGHLAVGDQRLIFRNLKSLNARARDERIITSRGTQEMLQRFYDIGSRSNDQKVRQILLPKLEKLKETTAKEVEKRTGGKRFDFGGHLTKQEKIFFADLDYVIAVFQGNNSAELPPNSRLFRNNDPKVASVTKSEPAIEKKPAVKNELAIKNETIKKSEPVRKDQPVYQGKTFDQWITTLKIDRDPKVQFEAIEAGLAIMETEQQQKQILEGTRGFMKTLDRKFNIIRFADYNVRSYRREMMGSEKKEIAQYNDLILRVLSCCERTLVFDFFKAEIETGPPVSLQICSNWLATGAYRTVIFDRHEELNDTFAKNFDKPGVRKMARYLIDGTSLQGEALTQFQESALGKKLKAFVQTATPEQRMDILYFAFKIFPDDQQVLQTYQKDLIDPNLKDAVVRLILFKFMVDNIAHVKYYQAQTVDAATRQQRLATAADWLAKVMEGHLAVGAQRLFFTGDSRPNRVESLVKSKVTQQMLQSFYDIGSRSSDAKIRQKLLPRLEKLKQSIAREVNEKMSVDQRRGMRRVSPPPQILKDVEYVIAVFQGNTPAKLPPGSKLKIIAIPSVTSDDKKEPAPKAKPAPKEKPSGEGNSETLEGKTLTEWFKVLETDKDAFKQAKAMKACTAFLASKGRNEELDAMLQKFLSKRPPLSSFGQDDDEYIRFLGFAEAFGKLSPAHAIEFLKLQLKEGSEIPLQWTFNGLFARRDIRSSQAIMNELKSKAGELLALISKRKKEGSINYIFEFIVENSLEKPLSVDSLDAIRGVLITLKPLDLFKAVKFVPEHLVTADLFVATKTKLLAQETSVKERDELIEALMKLDDNIYRKTDVAADEVYAALLANQLFDLNPVKFDQFQKMKIYTKKKSDGVEYRSIEASMTTPRGFTEIEIKDPAVVPRKLLNKICERLLIKKQKNPQAAAAKIYAVIENASSNAEDASRNDSEFFKVLEIERDLDELKKLSNNQHGEFSEYPSHWIKRKF